MDISTVTSATYAKKSPAEQSREVRESSQAKAIQETIQKRHQTEGRPEGRQAEKARIATAAFEDSVESTNRGSVDDGIDQMVRAVARQQATEKRANEDVETEHDPAARERFIREQVNSVYSETENKSSQQEATSTPEQTARQQQQGADVYRSADRSGIDRTLELVI